MLGLLAFAVFAIGSLSVVNRHLLNTSSLAAIISTVLVDLANADRDAYAARGLTVNPVLTAAAQAKADDMAAKGYFAHVSPDGKNSWYWFKEAGYSFAYAGENLAVDFSDSADVERAWMNSPTHRKNILDTNFTEIGIAVARGTFEGRSTTFVVQMFGTPAAVGASAEVETVTLPAEPTAPALATTEPRAASVSEAPPTTVVGTAAAAHIATGLPSATPVLGTEATVVRAPAEASWWEHLFASPKTLLRYAYFLLAGVILLLLGYVTELEFHRRHTRHVAAAGFLFALMAVLFVVADAFIFAEPVIAALL